MSAWEAKPRVVLLAFVEFIQTGVRFVQRNFFLFSLHFQQQKKLRRNLETKKVTTKKPRAMKRTIC